MTNPTQTTKTTQPTQPTLHLLADDQYATIWYSGCEKEENIYFGDETIICFMVQNKTDYQFAFGVDSLAINGWTLTDIIEYENVAPNSKAIIKVSTEQLKSLDVKTISGVLVMWDVSFELWGDVSRNYPINATIS